jgi:hypothetical protein
MSAQPIEHMKIIWQELRPRVRRALVHALLVLREVWDIVRPPLFFAIQVVAALILLFEEWGWRPLVAALDWVARWKPIARLELFIAGLPPYAALVALALPSSVLLPLKFVALWLLANGFYVWAGALFVFAKVSATALIARVFLLTKPALMRIGWFAAGYNLVMPWKDRLFATIRESWVWRYSRMLKNRLRIETKQAWTRARPTLVELWQRARTSAFAFWLRLKPRLEREMLRMRLALLRAVGRG